MSSAFGGKDEVKAEHKHSNKVGRILATKVFFGISKWDE